MPLCRGTASHPHIEAPQHGPETVLKLRERTAGQYREPDHQCGPGQGEQQRLNGLHPATKPFEMADEQ